MSSPTQPSPGHPQDASYSRLKPLLEQMTWPEARQAALDGGRVVLLPVGAIEQHGPHLPVDVDNRIVTWLCDEAARRRPDLILSAPPIHYGFNEHNMGFPGTVTVAVEHFVHYVYDVCHSFVRQGHTRIVQPGNIWRANADKRDWQLRRPCTSLG